jgi:NAD-dependent dihydropyrimidine dehydrogenase PreA subunit
MTLTIDPPYCKGKHLCQICGNVYDCEGLAISHSTNANGGRCQGNYEQFCPNHTPRQYMKAHIELGDL